MKKAILLYALTLLVMAGSFGPNPRAFGQQPQEAIIALEGLDPVLLAEGKEVQGKMNLSVTHKQFQYLFAGAESKAAFEKDPGRYEIQAGGACARMGPPVSGNPDMFTVYKRRVYIFGSENCKKVFEANPELFLEPDPPAKAAAPPEAVERGRALIEKAVEAIGGEAKLDALTSYQETGSTAQRRAQGEVELKIGLTRVFPDRVRQERAAPDYSEAAVITPTDAFVVTSRGARAMSDAQRAFRERQLKLNVLSILRARKGAGFRAVAAGQGKVGEAVVEQVAVELDGLSARLAIEASTGRVLGIYYRGRGPAGTFGEVAQVFSDFRAVEGMTLPFKTTGTFNGEPEPAQSFATASIIINGKVDPARFERPKQ